MITPAIEWKTAVSALVNDFHKACDLIKLYLHGFLFHDEVSEELLKIGLDKTALDEYEAYTVSLIENQKKHPLLRMRNLDDVKPGKPLSFFFLTYAQLQKVCNFNIWRKKEQPDNTILTYKGPQFPGSSKFIFVGRWLEELGFVKIGNYLFGRTIQPYMVSDTQVLKNVVVCFDISNIKDYEILRSEASIDSAILGLTGFGEFCVYTLTNEFRKRYDINKWVPENEPAFACILYARKKTEDLHEVGEIVLDVKSLDKEIFITENTKTAKQPSLPEGDTEAID